jgi:hypothetical protein
MEREVLGSHGRLSLVRAAAEDAPLIAAVASRVNAGTYGGKEKGFLVYSLTVAEYRERIGQGWLVCLLLADEETVGFFLGVESEVLLRERQHTAAAEAAYEFALGHAAANAVPRFLFASQMAIAPEKQDGGMGARFLAMIVAHAQVRLYADIMEEPVRNPRIDFWVHQGFERIGECRERLPERFQFAGVSEVVWGIYTLSPRP